MFRDALASGGIHLARDREEESEAYPYQSYWQPVLAGFAFAGCLVILLICNGVFMWKQFHIIPFCSGYLTVGSQDLYNQQMLIMQIGDCVSGDLDRAQSL
jgi:amino acid permease